MTPQSTDKTTKVDFRKLPEVIECVVKPIKLAILYGDGDFEFLTAKNLVYLHDDLKKHCSGENFVAFSDWHRKYVHQQKQQLKSRLAKMAPNNKKKTPQRPPPRDKSSSPEELTPNSKQAYKDLASQGLQVMKSAQDKAIAVATSTLDKTHAANERILDKTHAANDTALDKTNVVAENIVKEAHEGTIKIMQEYKKSVSSKKKKVIRKQDPNAELLSRDLLEEFAEIDSDKESDESTKENGRCNVAHDSDNHGRRKRVTVTEVEDTTMATKPARRGKRDKVPKKVESTPTPTPSKAAGRRKTRSTPAPPSESPPTPPSESPPKQTKKQKRMEGKASAREWFANKK